MMACTIRDIAKACNVSEGTVDRALNNRSGISAKTKEKILRIAKEMNYEPNHLARCLATGSTKTIGVICASITSNFFSALVESIEYWAGQNGYFINLIVSRGDRSRELEGVHYMINRRIDGLIIFPAKQGEDYVNEFKKLNVPIVTIYNRISEEFTHVDVDCRTIMRNAVKMMSRRGYNRIIYVDFYRNKSGKDNNTFSIDERMNGYKEGVKLLGMPQKIYNECQGEDIVEEIILNNENQGYKMAVLCVNDMVAIKLLNLFRIRGLRVPDDVGIMGFDNINMLDVIIPKINSVDCHIRNIGRTAVDILISKINGEENLKDVVLDYSFTEGDTL